MAEASYIVEPAKLEDAQAIWNIRFHPSVSQRSLKTEAVDFQKHDQWFKDKYFKNHDNKCFVLRSESEAVGYCRFDLEQNGAYLASIAIRPDYQGRGLGQLLFSESLEQLQTTRPILATIKKNNAASLKLFQKNNFMIYKEDGDSYFLKRDCCQMPFGNSPKE